MPALFWAIRQIGNSIMKVNQILWKFGSYSQVSIFSPENSVCKAKQKKGHIITQLWSIYLIPERKRVYNYGGKVKNIIYSSLFGLI